ncbi:MAG: hypothetical protein ACFFCI_01645 [Promethearchaeota archaeon]
MARLLYPHIRDITGNSVTDRSELTKSIIDRLFEKINPIFHMRIDTVYLTNLHKMSIKEFESWLKKLQAKLRVSNKFHHNFTIYLRWLIREVFVIVTEIGDTAPPSKFEQVILNELKKFYHIYINQINQNFSHDREISTSKEGLDQISELESQDQVNKSFSEETLDKIIKKCQDLNIEVLNLPDYEGRTSILRLLCKKCNHGNEKSWYKTGNNILKPDWKGCPLCIKRSKNFEYFKMLKAKAKEKGIEIITDFTQYQNSRTRIMLSCINPDCLFGQNGDWLRRASSILESNFHGCPKCNRPQKIP